MSTLSSQSGVLRAGINHHVRRLRNNASQAKSNASGVVVQPRDLFFDVNTIKRAAASKKKTQKNRSNDIEVVVTGPTGWTLTFDLDDDFTIADLKKLIEDEEGFDPEQQRILLDGDDLEDEMTLGECDVGEDATLDLVLKLRGVCKAYQMHNDCFDEDYNYDFTDISADQKAFSRGGAQYIRPLGSMRYALGVLDKYEDNAWLGDLERRHEHGSIDEEWPVAYHGTTDPRAAEIVGSGGFDLSKGTRFLFGRGIYCTPDPKTALAYASPFKYEGENYKLIVQARVDPSRFKVVPKSEHCVEGLDDYWIVEEDDAIRPYGICVYPC